MTKKTDADAIKATAQLLTTLGVGYEGIIDRQDRIIDRLCARNEMLERLLLARPKAKQGR